MKLYHDGWNSRCNSQFISPQVDHIRGYVLPSHTTPQTIVNGNPPIHHNTKISFTRTLFWSMVIFGKNYFSNSTQIQTERLVLNILTLEISKCQKIILLANLILHKQAFALLSYCFSAVTYFVSISFNVLIFYFNKEKED